MEIEAAVARTAGGDFSVERLTLGELRPTEALVRVVATGLCHTDLVVRDQILPLPLPAVLGHEGAGIVEAVGDAVTSIAPGDAVVMGFAACRACPQCDAGQPAYCRDFAPLNFGGHRTDGSTCLHDGQTPVSSHFFGQSSFGTYAIVAAQNLVKMPSDAPLELLGPLGCGIMTGAGAVMNALKLQAGESILIIGGGPVGLSAVMAARALHAGQIIVADPLESRRAMAVDLGATGTIDVRLGDTAEQLRAIQPQGVHCVLDTSGVIPAIESGIAALAPLGRLAMVGVPKAQDAAISLNILHMLSLGISICGVTEGNADPQTFLPELVALNAKGLFPFERLITRYRLEDINQAVADQHAGRCVKAVLTMG
ncbi:MULTISPECIES: NAD(P)-dependent alcohol dehydrogenase [Sphingobium]|jgi:aryl-alcohol dehydrogenase|uniref:Aryl-alcohol dehydrogenase n=1 Tax=Sphingobium yanoikuyae TaxID=13690 RepID=A0A084E2B3_SPHYA|nr:NAD(P)-dependent alcohol dehydrogenase [Sphingobium yanoikuyae]KEZ12105.1 Aryl-alcohol dehydrogenase [Sphingobium yanoikuyae]NBB42298.1 alcohol dehydrogenase catalytic domain-containing protein [Sphingobium yanoikuyae]